MVMLPNGMNNCITMLATWKMTGMKSDYNMCVELLGKHQYRQYNVIYYVPFKIYFLDKECSIEKKLLASKYIHFEDIIIDSTDICGESIS